MQSKPVILLLLLLLTIPGATVTAAEYRAEHSVTEVTVFPSRASITRQTKLQLPAGEHAVIFDQLPLKILDNTLFSTAEASGALTIIGADIKTVHQKPTNSSRAARLKNALEKINDKINQVQMQKQLIDKEILFLNSIRISTVADINKQIKLRTITPDKWNQLYTFVFTRLSAKQQQLRTIELELKKLLDRKNNIVDQYDNATGSSSRYFKRVVVTVKAATALNCKINIIYQQKNATWGPGYDFRLNEKSDNKTMQLTYFGTVTQRTGEDWHNIKLQLSTAQTSRWSAIPNTYPWYLDIITVRRNRYYNGSAKGLSQSRQTLKKSNEKIPARNYLQDKQRAGYRQTKLQRGSTAVTFAVPGKVTLTSDGTASRKVLQTVKLPVSFTYKAIPQMSADVFIEAKVKNSSDLFLLPGRAQLFRGNGYLGTTRIQATPPNGELSLFYGTDPSLSTKKELVEKKMDPGSDNELKYLYKLTLKNNKTVPVTVELIDMLPVSRNDNIEVSIKDLSVDPVKKEKNGKYHWKFTLKPGEEKSVSYKLEIEYPSQKRVSGLR